jgi:hypothetical protein
MKNAVFLYVTPCGCCKCKKRALYLHFVFLRSVHQLLVTANVPSSPILVTLMTGVLNPSETSNLTRATWHNIPEDDILELLCSIPFTHFNVGSSYCPSNQWEVRDVILNEI